MAPVVSMLAVDRDFDGSNPTAEKQMFSFGVSLSITRVSYCPG